MADYQRVTVPFLNQGVVQKLDPSLLSQGQYTELINAISVQEGSLSSRYGSTRAITASPGNLIHTLKMFRLAATTDKQFLYVGEGQDIHRFQMSDGAGGAFTNLSAGLGASTWGQRWTGVDYDPGTSRKAYFFIATDSKMLKDKAIDEGGSETSAFEKWGIVPPPSAVIATLASAGQSKVVTIDTSANTWDESVPESFTVENNVLSSSPVDLSTFTGGAASGHEAQGFDSKGDYIELKFTPSEMGRFHWFRLQFSVYDTNYTHYYERYIIPNNSTVMEDGGTSVPSYMEVVNSTFGTELDPVDDGVTVTVKITKNEFFKFGNAGQAGYDWSDVKHVRIRSKSLSLGDSALTLTPVSLTLKGGTGLRNIDNDDFTAYRWVYTYRNDETGFESNPCPLMVDGNWLIDAEQGSAALTGVTASSDSQVTSYSFYRAGGSYVDGLYRHVGTAKASGFSSFTDALADYDILNSPLCEWDHDPPVPSRLPTALNATLPAITGTGSQNATLTVNTPSGITNLANFSDPSPGYGLTVGTRMWVLDHDKSEQIQITAISGLQITANFQNTHAAGVVVTCETITNQPGRLACRSGESIYVAGDKANPHVLYQSKIARPESFPTIVEGTGTAGQQAVGSPSNPIMAITDDFGGGGVLCLNLNSIFIVRTGNGGMYPPVETPAGSGLISSTAWCKGDNAIYYLSHDGIYKWTGGQAVKVSEAIGWFFNDKTVAGIAPMSKAKSDTATSDKLQWAHMAYHQDEVHFICRDTSDETIYWCYNTLYDRWYQRKVAQEGGTGGYDTGIGAFLPFEEKLYSARHITNGGGSTSSYVYLEDQGTADNSNAFEFTAKTGWIDLGEPTINKQWGDVVLEYNNATGASISLKTYYDHSGTVSETITLPTTSGRTRIPFPLNSGAAKEAYAMMLEFTGNSTATGGITLHNMTFNWLPLAEVQRGRAYDYKSLEYPHDKRLDQLIVEYDTDGNNVVFDLDCIHGINGSSEAQEVQQFTLNSAGRAQATLPVRVKATSPPTGYTANGIVVCKMARLRPNAGTAANFKLWDYSFTYEKYPPDITYFTDPSDYGSPYSKYWQQLVIDVDTGGVAATCEVFIDDGTSSTATKYQSLSINTTSATRQQTITLNPGIVGKKARLVVTPGSGGKFQLFSHTFITLPADKGPVVHTFDWDTLGHPYDKRLYGLSIEYEVASTTIVDLNVLTGLTGAQSTSTSSNFTLSTGGRRVEFFPINDVIAKAVRLEPRTTHATMQEWKYEFKFEPYPPDVVRQTELTDEGSPFDKYWQQLTLDIDTGGYACSVAVEVDGTTEQTISVTSSTNDRRRTYTLEPGIIGKKARLKLTPHASGKSQLFGANFVTLPADKGPVLHTYDWDDLGHPYDKRLYEVVFEYEVTSPVTMNMYTLTGVTGAQSSSLEDTFTLSTSGRKLETFTLDDVICKMVRFEPASNHTAMKSWKYRFQQENYPADAIEQTQWESLDYECEKVLQSLIMEVDTGGVAASVDLEGDGGTVLKTFSVNTTDSDRTHVETLYDADNELIAYKVRLVPTPGSGGKFQLFSHKFNRTLEPCPLVEWDSYEQFFGSVGWRWLKQCWIMYKCAGQIKVYVYDARGGLLHTETLPSHSTRSVERFYLPAVNGSVLNKSRGHRLVIQAVDSSKPFYLYRDNSRIEVKEVSGDQRAGFRQIYLHEHLGIQK